MAEITIKIFDTVDGAIDLDAVFNPEFNKDHKSTPAQNFAGYVLQFIQKTAEEMKEHAKAQGQTPDTETESASQEQEEVQ